MPVRELAERFGRSRGAIRSRLKKLGVSDLQNDSKQAETQAEQPL